MHCVLPPQQQQLCRPNAQETALALAMFKVRDSSDSDHSSPELDQILNKTLANGPLSTSLMNDYFDSLYSALKKKQEKSSRPSKTQEWKLLKQKQDSQLNGVKSENSLFHVNDPFINMDCLSRALPSTSFAKPRTHKLSPKALLSALPSDERITDLNPEMENSQKSRPDFTNGCSSKIKFVLGDDCDDAEVAVPPKRPKNINLQNANKHDIHSSTKTPQAPQPVSHQPRVPLKKSVSCPYQTLNHSAGIHRANTLLKSVMKKEFGPKEVEVLMTGVFVVVVNFRSSFAFRMATRPKCHPLRIRPTSRKALTVVPKFSFTALVFQCNLVL
jgi:hypothetical protein